MAYNLILLDIDGVLAITPGWKRSEINSDGFIEFNKRAVINLIKIISKTSADVILTTSHRNNYSLSKWKSIMDNRGIQINNITTIDNYVTNNNNKTRVEEIRQWINDFGKEKNYVIIDDDTSLDNLPLSIKKRWVKTSPMIGLDDNATTKALEILNGVTA